MPRLLASLLLGALLTGAAAAQDARFEGRVTQAGSGEPLIGATVVLEGTVYGVATDTDGRYGFSAPPGAYVLTASYVGYEGVRREVRPAPGEVVAADFVLEEAASAVSEVVVTGASRRAEKLTDSPATVQVISAAELEAFPGFSYEQALARLKGVDFVRTGISGVGINARGFNSAFNSKMLLLTDGRRSIIPGNGLPLGNMNTVTKEDVDRVEVILGPSSALYGPNAHNGIINVITKDPRNTPGLTLTAEGGAGGADASVYSVRGRYAQAFADKRFALKLTGEYTGGTDFAFDDSVYVATPAGTVAVNEDPSLDVSHARGGADLFYSPVPDADVVLSYSASRNDYLGVTNLGRNQIDDWSVQVLQLRATTPRFFAQAYQTWSNSGQTFALQNRAPLLLAGVDADEARERARFKDQSSRFNAEAQFNDTLYGFGIVAGADYEREEAVSSGTYLSDTTGTGLVFSRYGVALQLERQLVGTLRAVGAGRYDYQENYGSQFSPKLGLVYGLGGQLGSLRVTYGQAFLAPSVLQQELYIPLGATATGVPIVARGNAQGYTVLNAQGQAETVDPLVPEVVRTVEVGYKGLPSGRLFVDVNAYYSTEDNFVSPLSGIGFATATGTGDDAFQRQEVVLTYRNFGEVASYGADLGLTYFLNDRITIGGTYSFFDSDIDEESFDLNNDGVVSPNEISLNTPGHKGSLSFTARDVGMAGLSAALTVRGVSQYSFVSGRHFASDQQEGERVVLTTPGGAVPFNYNYGPLGGFVTADVSAGYQFTPTLQVGAAVTNLFGVEQREFVGSPPTPTFVTASLKTTLPAFGR
ncbi:TonB-dependent receptor [Rubrivirga litoralis]|uniref:TonB-dependent receptor n=1 Tax=Rubrivirga litoralis TaxID=3075598 RepID=A0ABU3BLG0_9BACT|nr:TonB-dependent receptor [Rubrivirga sp. F394]MDT0630129.1 TonB-dependent receptor [Rubrivirga sp. F394]